MAYGDVSGEYTNYSLQVTQPYIGIAAAADIWQLERTEPVSGWKSPDSERFNLRGSLSWIYHYLL